MTHQQRNDLVGDRIALTPAETARAIGVSLRTLFSLIERGSAPPFIDLNPHGRKRVLRFPVRALERWLAERADVGRSGPIIRLTSGGETARGGADDDR